jgi:WXG100 family type VII secretion target
MALDGTIHYDYDLIDHCLVRMDQEAKKIQGEIDELVGQVKAIMVDWEGSTATAYEQLSTDLSRDLTEHRQNLDNLNRTLDDAAEKMRQKDKSGGGNIAGS